MSLFKFNPLANFAIPLLAAPNLNLQVAVPQRHMNAYMLHLQKPKASLPCIVILLWLLAMDKFSDGEENK